MILFPRDVFCACTSITSHSTLWSGLERCRIPGSSTYLAPHDWQDARNGKPSKCGLRRSRVRAKPSGGACAEIFRFGKSEVRILWPRSRTSLSCVTGCIWMHCIRCGQVCPSCGGPARPAILMFGALGQVRKIDCKILTSQSFDPCVLIRTDISFDVLTLFDIVHGRNVSNHLKWCKQWLIDDDRC